MSTSPNQKLNITLSMPFDVVPKLDEELDKAQKKVGKYNFEFRVLKIPTVVEYKGQEVNGIEYLIQTEAPVIKYKNYTYLATLKKETVDSDDFLVHASSKAENLDLSQYHDIDFRCDHCGTNRYRKTVHVFRNNDGDDMVVAASCAKVYFGIDIESRLRKIVRYFEMNILKDTLKDYIDQGNGPNWISKYQLNPTDKDRFCGLVFGIILDNHGNYVSSARADVDGGEVSTTSQALILYNHMHYADDKQRAKDMLKLAASKNYNFQAVYDYWQDKTDKEDFTHNIQVALNMVQPKMGLLSYAVWDYMRNNVLPKRKKFFEYKSNHVGTVGTKISGTATIVSIKDGRGPFGFYQIVQLADDKENLYTWFYNGTLSDKFSVDTKVNFSTVVKKHDVFNDQKITIIKRAKLEVA